MQTTYDFLDTLGLDEAALERDIRRAYARKLKQIDQEAEPAAFQALRDAYEVALDWARWKLAQGAQEAAANAPADVPAAHAPVPEDAAVSAATTPPMAVGALQQPEPATPAHLGADAYHRFLAAAGELVVLPKHGDVAAWRAAIEARFADPELVNIDARIYYEAYIASLLASGWRPGHEVLFVAAQEAFGWADDQRGLRQLGQAGRMLDQAIEERRLFETQQTTDRARMRDLVKMLRQEELPATRRIRAAMPDVERMLGRFPAFMAVVASMENVERWRTVYRESGGPPVAAEVEDTVPPPAEPKRTFTTLQGAMLVLALFAVLRAMFNHSGGEQHAGSGGFFPPGAQQHQQEASAQVPRHVLDRVVPAVSYTPPPGTSLHQLEVVYKVFLSFDNKVERVQNWLTSGEPAFDQAVGDALRAAGRFPLGTPREFQVRYTGAMVRPGQPPAFAGSPNLVRPPAPVPAPVPATRPLTLDQVRKHLPPVQYKPGPGTRTGRYTGHYKVTLDADGKVKDVTVAKPSGDAGLDQAVQDAVRKAKPFPAGSRGFEFSYWVEFSRKPQAVEAQPKTESMAEPQEAAQPPAEPPAGTPTKPTTEPG